MRNKYLQIGLFVVAITLLVVGFVVLSGSEESDSNNQTDESRDASVQKISNDTTVLRADGKYDEAEAQLIDYLDQDELSAEQRSSATEQLAGIYADTERPQEAIDLLEEFIANNEPTEGAYSILAGTNLLLDNKEEAIRYYKLQLESMDSEDVLYEVESSELKQYIEELENED